MTEHAQLRTTAAEEPASGESLLKPDALLNAVLLALLAGLAIGAWILLVDGGWDYYRTPVALRGAAKAHRFLRPAGPGGNVLGIAGTLVMLSTLLYVVRKRVRLMSGMGSTKAWLEVHIFCGLFGPILITFHTSFKFNGIISVAYWSMVLVVLSGFVGRYLFVRIPKTIRGKELTRAELEQRAGKLKAQLAEASLPAGLLRRIDDLESWVASRETAQRTFVRILSDRLAARRRMAALRRDVRRSILSPALLHDALDVLDERATLLNRIAHLKRTRELFQLWHVFHRPLVWVMFTIFLLHLGVAIYFGYTVFGK